MGKEKIHLVGKMFDRWLVICEAEPRYDKYNHKRRYWLCECQCDFKTKKEIVQTSLTSGLSGSCGCKQKETVIIKGSDTKENLLDMQFGRWTVIGDLPPKQSKSGVNFTVWLCMCSCDNKTIKKVRASNLKKGNSKSCGCLKIEEGRNGNKHNAQSKYLGNKILKRLYSIYTGMKERCYNPNSEAYKHYGGRGLSICDDWLNNFMVFHDWSILNGYEDELTIDRIDNDGNYEPNNCRWATHIEQANNKRNNRLIEINGFIKTVAQWARDSGLPYGIVAGRVFEKWSSEDIIKPVGHVRIEQSKSYKLKEEEVIYIWENRRKFKRKELADKFNVSLAAIKHIYNGSSWKHLYERYKGK